jgi:hypothetical protein
MNTRYVLLLTLVTVSATVQLQGQGSAASKAERPGHEAVPPIVPNRTLPKVSPPKTGLEFSANPTTQEIFRARVFEEPLVPIGGEPGADENADLAAALLGYAKRSGPDDFASLTGFLEKHPNSPWRAALLTVLGLEYYNTAYYSRALEAWQQAWALGQKATDARGKFLADRAVCELAGLYSRLGRMNELEALLKSIERRGFIGGATERISMAWEALSIMQHQPGKSDEGLALLFRQIQPELGALQNPWLVKSSGSRRTNLTSKRVKFPTRTMRACPAAQMFRRFDVELRAMAGGEGQSVKPVGGGDRRGGFPPVVSHIENGAGIFHR